MTSAELYMEHDLHKQHHTQWNVVSPKQYVAWKILDGKRYPAHIPTRAAPMNWVFVDYRKN